ncbi:DUF1109 domain-containing protein [Halovulum dunhuangense]|uniref:DUF1109 domain-containing protein n=1 Tax=Halovulum dunhuangense TaxID=1505036 RepID=A0A849L6N4_9RHOB|nr:DUF1109 domain-containing protein [Halovulum dunhuangense]NNU81804.1 DUF1109 domain-containing protein [Halovulum dunhuangense]
MKTDDLIAALAADTLQRPGAGRRLLRAAPPAAALSVLALLAFWGPRPDLAAALMSVAVLKHLLPLALAALAATLALWLSRPETRPGGRATLLLVYGGALVAGFGVALARGGAPGVDAALANPTLVTCLYSIPLLALPMLAATLWALSSGAPQRPALSGALAGLVSGGVAAAIYAIYCDQDAALFVLPAYGTGILVMTALGSVIGARVLRW